MKNKIMVLFLLIGLSSCYVYRPAEAKKGEEKIPVLLQEQIEPNKFYRITAEGETYKIKAQKWEQDTLVVHVNGKEKNERKFHVNQISHVENRVFSRGRSNAVTFGSYAIIGAVIYYLLQ